MTPKKRGKRPEHVTEVVPVYKWFRFLERYDARGIALPVSLLFGLLIRWCVALHGYSGYQQPPMYGDYEAQRHWMEITTHLPASKWYFYDLQYWGLDYPPLTAFQSWLCGYIANLIDPSWVALDKSRGIETHSSKLFMRASVAALEFSLYVPAVVLLFRSRQLSMPWLAKQVAIFTVLLQPCLLLIDHGHFQYNSVMLGFLIWSVYFAAEHRFVLMAISFCSPALLLANDEHWAVNWFTQVALFSMYPLLFKDQLQIPYWVLAIGWSLLRSCPACPADKRTPRLVILLQWLSTLVMVIIHLLHALVPPPPSLPDIYVVANVLFSCVMFIFFFIYFNYRQFTILHIPDAQTKSKTD
ncbi:Glucosyltransferase-like protein [Coemansia sp. RSA 1358]|nr:Glucosyltransferase-like protein [Coemansia sp. RSA 1358]